MPEFKLLKYSVENFIATVALNRPPVNALGRDLLAEIRSAADLAIADAAAKKVRAVVIRGEGKCFSAGADLKERLDLPVEKVEGAVRHISGAIRRVGEIPVPVIAAVHGVAMGGGFELALAADLRVMAEDARVGLRETALAIIPGAGGTQRLPKIIGYSKALRWIAAARVFSGREAFEQGAADFVAPENQVVATAMGAAREIAANGPVAVAQAKRAVRAAFDLPLAEGLDRELELYLPVIPTRDRVEGLRAFSEKRAPEYRGE